MSKYSEAQLRDWLWENRKNWYSLIDDLPQILQSPDPIDVMKMSPEGLLWELTRRRLVHGLNLTRNLSLLGFEVLAGPKETGIMKMDLFGVPWEIGEPGLGIIELKIGRTASRNGFTELLGYGNGLRLQLPGLCREDLVHVLIMPMSESPAIVRHAVASFLTFDQRPIVVLDVQGNLGSGFRLIPWIPERETLNLLSRSVFRPENIDIGLVHWDGVEHEWEQSNLTRVAASGALALEGAGILGFVHAGCSQVDMAMPNFLVCAGLNPYRAAASIKLALSNDQKLWSIEGMRLSDVIPGIQGSSEEGSMADDLECAESSWSVHLRRLAHKTMARCTLNTGGVPPSYETAVMRLSEFRSDWGSNLAAERTAIFATGRLREMWELCVEFDYAAFVRDGEFSPDAQLYEVAVSTLTSYCCFDEFIQRMFKEGGSVGAILREFGP